MWLDAGGGRNRTQGLSGSRYVSLALLVLICMPPASTRAAEFSEVATASDAFTAYDAARNAVSRQDYARAESLLAQWLSSYPDDAPARFLRARVLAWNGQRSASLEEFETLLQTYPSNTDYMLGKARVLLWDGRPAEAADCLQDARRLQPEYQDLWKLELRALRASDEPLAKQRGQALMLEAKHRFPEASWVADESDHDASASTRYLQISAGLVHEYLSDGLPDWSSVSLLADYHFDARRVLYTHFRQVDRFNKIDNELLAGVIVPAGSNWLSAFEVTISRGAEVLPRYSTAVRLGRAFAGGWGMGFEFRHASYAKTYSDAGSLSIDQYWRSWRFAYRISTGKAEDAQRTVTHAFRTDYYYRDMSMVGLSLVTGKESESAGLGRLVTTDVAAASLLGLHWFARNWALRWRVGYHQQGKLYHRVGIDVALRHRF